MFNIRHGRLETPEFTQLIDCCRRAFAQHPESKGVLQGDLDWELFLRLARRHRVQGLVWRSLHNTGHSLPPAVRNALEADARIVAQDGLQSAIECAKLLQAMSSAGVPILFLKGLPLGKLAYGDPFVKMSWDIDILISIEQLPAAASTLRDMAYEPVMPKLLHNPNMLAHWHTSRKESVWRRLRDNTHVELHTRPTDSPHLLPTLGAESPNQKVFVTPGIALPTFANEELFAYLCVHGATSAWFRLKWLADLAALLSRSSSKQVTQLYRLSQRLGAGRASAQALLTSRAVFGTRLERSLIRELNKDRVNRLLANTAWRQMTRITEPTGTRFGTGAIHLTQFLMQPGLGFKLGELRRQLRDAAGNRF